MKMKKTDIGVVVFMYAVCAYFYYHMLQLKASSQTYPRFTIILLFGLTTLYLVQMLVAAKKYGVDCFLFDAYFYEEEEFLHRCLNEGFLKAENTKDMEFALMWANHTWTNIHPASLDKESEVEFRGEVSEEAFKRITRKIINTYFTCENYMRMDGKPYFSIYAISSLLSVFKSVSEINRLLKEFREDARKVVGEIHINAVIGELSLLHGEDIEMGFPLLNQLDVDSYSSYCWLHHYHMDGHFPTDEYDNAAN